MRKIFTLMFAVMLAGQAWAQEFVVDNFKYKIIDAEEHYVSIGAADTSQIIGDLVIPSTVENDGVTYTITEISWGGFAACNKLTSVIIPNTVIRIGDESFIACHKLHSVTIPNSVKSIGENAFEFCYSLTSISIPDSVTAIGKYAFYECSNLTSANIPDSVKEISDYMFGGCYSLSKVSIPNSITRIGQQAFWGCGRLSLDIPNSVETIGLGAFDYVANIIYTGNVEGSEALTVNGIIDGDFIYSDVEKTNLTAYTGEGGDVVIPDGVISIGEYAFSCSKLTSVIIGNSVKSIGMSAFERCSGITSLSIGNSVDSIGSWAFGGCIGLTSVTIPKSVMWIGSRIFENNQTLTIYCEESSKPKEWASDWNSYDFWGKEFCTVVWAEENTEPGTVVIETAANAVNIYAHSNTIVVENATDEILVYNIMGTVVGRDVACNVCTITINNPGLYIVKTGNTVQRVVVN